MLNIGITFSRLKQIGLTYALAAEYVKQGSPKDKLAELKQKIKTAEWQYSRRQMTWFKRDKRIRWIKHQKEAEKLVKNHLRKYFTAL